MTPDDISVIYEQYYPRMVNYVFRRTNDYHTSEDITSRAFLYALEHCADIENGKSYIYRSLKNGLIDRARHYNRTQEHPLDVLDYDYRVEFEAELLIENELPDILRMSKLTEPQAKVIYYLLQGYDFGEIAVLMKMTIGSVKALRHRAVNRMRNIRHIFEDGYNSRLIRKGQHRTVRVRYR